MIPLAIPNLTGNEKKYLDDCIDSTFVSSVGQYVTKLEEMVATATGSSFAVATSAGTTGLHVALTSVDVNHNDLVIIPTFTFIATANSVAHCGAQPWIMDIDPRSWCLDAKLVRTEIEKHCTQKNGVLIHIPSGKRVAALMPVLTLGNSPDMKEMRRIADDYMIPLVVDAACAIGATYGGAGFGPLADLSVISFNGNKTITCGGGGAVVGNNEQLLSHVRHLTTTARVWPDYDFDEVGFNYRMTNLQAAVGVAQMERLNSFLKKKRYIRQYYEKRMSELKEMGFSFIPTTDGSSCWFSGFVLPKNAVLDTAKKICAQLKNSEIEAKTFWKPIHLQKPYVDCPRSRIDNSESLWQRIITLPCSTSITEEELEFVVNKTIEAINKVLA